MKPPSISPAQTATASLGMYDESILELEEIEGEDRWHPSVVEARYKTYRDAKEWELAMTMARVLAEGMPDKLEWLKNQADAMTECGDTQELCSYLKTLLSGSERTGNTYFAVGRQYSLLCEIEEAKKYVKKAFRADSSLKAEFLDDPAFDAVWESFDQYLTLIDF